MGAATLKAASQRAELLQNLLDQTVEAVLAVDRNGKPLAFNAAAVRVLRMDPAQTNVTQWAEYSRCYLPDTTTLCPPDQLPITRAMRGETTPETVLFVRYPDVPEGFWVAVRAWPRLGPDGAPDGATVVFRDITEAQRAKAALKRSEERFRALIENVQDILLVLDRDGTIRYVNPTIQNLLGYLPEELLVRDAFSLLHPEDRPKILDLVRAGGERPDASETDEFRVRHKNGTWRLLAGVGKNQLDNPEIGGIVITAQDITELKRADQQALLRTSLLDHLRSAVIALDMEGRIIYWNSFASKLCHWTPEEVLGKNIREVTIPPPNRGRYEQVIGAVLKTGYFEGELPLLRRDGTTFPAVLTVTAVRDRRGLLIGYAGVAVDVTEQKQAEEHLKASGEQLRQLATHNQSLRETERARIARDIHDEMGQHLTALKIDLFHIAKDLKGKGARQEAARNIESAIGLVDSAIQSVRRISAELRPSILDDLGIASAIEWQLQEFQSRTRIRCAIRRPDEDVPLEPDCSTQVFRIFQEVLTNIARHANASAVRVGIKQENGHLVLNVRDNGKGITQQQIMARGSLGLLGMRERALQVNGELSIRGLRGKGTSVSLRVPISRQKGTDN